jgi:hypothetical protein
VIPAKMSVAPYDLVSEEVVMSAIDSE